jgi:Ca-activated chloride channel homolog
MRRLTLIAATLLCVIAVCSVLTQKGRTQEMATPRSADGFHTTASNIIIPQARSYALGAQANQIQISEVTAEVRILQQVATTTMDVGLTNSSGQQQEAEMLVPVPDGAVVRAFTFAGSASEPTAKLLPKAEAKTLYRSIVSKLKDPALLEFAGYNLVRSSVFPVPAQGKQRVRLVYEQILRADGNRVDYVLPRSESFEATQTPWKISVRVHSKSAISAVYSPSHQIGLERAAPEQALVRVVGEPKLEPGPFRLSYLVEGNGLTASLLAYPDQRIGGGYFLLLAGVPASTQASGPTIKREVTLVIDRSGSMAGEKIEQARAAALQVVEGLNDGEAFNVIDYSDSIARFSANPVIKNQNTLRQAREYIKRLRADGATNIQDALVEALRQTTIQNMLPLVIFLTDGLPTAGETRETAIRSAVLAANTRQRRIFSFGVGFDLNAQLLTSIANATRGTPTFVLPKENVEAKVSQVFRRLSGPVLADPQLATLDANGAVTTRAVRDLLPGQLNDVFEGDQIILLGQYQGDEPLRFRINGNYLGSPRTFDLKFDLTKATTRNAFVPRLWASRKIARLVEMISEAGADSASVSRSSNRGTLMASSAMALPVSTGAASSAVDPKLKELVDEIVRLSTEYGVLTEYTAFLALDGTKFSEREELNEQARRSLVDNAQNIRSGIGSVSQSVNVSTQRSQSNVNRSNNFLTQNMQRVEITNVQQITDRTFFRRNNRWVEANMLEREKDLKPDQTIEFGTPEFYSLVDRLVGEGRQGILALSGEMLLSIDGKTVLIKAPQKK